MPDDLAFAFAGPVLRLRAGLRQPYLPLPAEIADAWQAAGVRRLVGTLNGHPVRRAILGRRDGERYVALSRALLRDLGAEEGGTVRAILEPDPEPDRVDPGEELRAALAQDEAARARFEAMTPGRQRSLAHYVTSARRPETRVRRALELAHKLRTHTLYGDRRGE